MSINRDYWSPDGETAPKFKFSLLTVLGAVFAFVGNIFTAIAALFETLSTIFYSAVNWNISRKEMQDQGRGEIEMLVSGNHDDHFDIFDEDEDWSDDDGR